MKTQKSKIRSIQDMWRAMQELSTRPNRTEVEEAALRVCTDFFMCSQDFINMFDSCMEFITLNPPPKKEEECENSNEEGALSMFAGMSVAGNPVFTQKESHQDPIDQDLESKQLHEFHAMMESLDFDDTCNICDDPITESEL